MKVRFWGTRGSIAKAGPDTIRYGGNTSCVEVRSDSGTLVVIDCGTGAHGLGQSLVSGPGQPVRGAILISHTHWDHIQGIPFFAPLFIPGNEWDIYAPSGLGQSLRDTLAGQMQYTYFPITLETLGATIRYHDLVEGQFHVGDIEIQARYLNHPALTLGYRLTADGVSVSYACDHEPFSRQSLDGIPTIGAQDQQHVDFLRDCDLVIHDAQYTSEEYSNKIGWGHSTADYAVAVCRAAGVRQLALTHHDPMRDDDSVDGVVAAANEGQRDAARSMRIFAAAEGQTIELEKSSDVPSPVKQEEFSALTPVSTAVKSHSILFGQTDDATTKLVRSAATADDLPLHPVSDAEQARQIMVAEHPSLVIVDANAADGHTAEICEAVQEEVHGAASEVPVVAITDEEHDDAAWSGLVTEWLVRPFSEEYLRTRIRAWILRTSCRWVRARTPDYEEKRLEKLHSLGILDTEGEEGFDLVTRIASEAFGVPIALVSLVDRDRQWFKSRVGVDADETPRDAAFCAHAILDDQIMIVSDTLVDSRFADNPLVTGGPRIRFYAGYPLKLTDGSRIGTLCLIDTRPRQLDDYQQGLLQNLGRLVERELGRRPSPV